MSKFIKANHPYYIQSEDKKINIPINTIDNIRIYKKLKSLGDNSEANPSIWSFFHTAQLNLKEMTVIIDNDPTQILKLVRG